MRNQIITFKEYVTDVITSGTTLAFSINTYSINPGLANVFPWLSQIAPAFSFYRIRSLKACYVPTCGVAIANSTNVAYGTTLLRWVHDVTATADLTEQQMDCAYDTKRNPCYQAISLPLEIKGSHMKELSMRYGAQPSNTDLRFFDPAYLEVATSGIVGTTQTVGKLYLDYEIEFVRPQLYGGIVGNQLLNAHYKLLVSTATNQLGTSQSKIYDSIGISFVTPATCNAFSFPIWMQQGVYQITYTLNGTSNGSCQAPSINVSGGSLLSNFQGSSAQMLFTAPHNGTEETATAVCTVCFVQITGPAGTVCTVTYGNGNNMPSSTAYSDLFIVQTSGLMLT